MGDWEQRKFEDGTSKIGDGLHGTPEYTENGEVAFINGNNLVNGKIVINDQTKFVTSGQQSRADAELNENTMLMSINGTIGNLAWYRGEKLMLGKSAAYIEVKSFHKKFIYQLLQTHKIRNYFLNNLTGTTIKNLGLKTIRETPILIPKLDEQQKIGSFFERLDDTIALHLCKQQQFESLKKRLIKEILPQNDSVLPRLRFANFNNPWEQHQLKEVLKINSGRDYKHLNEGVIPVYGTGGYMLSVDGKLSDVDGIGLGRKGTIDKPQYLRAPFWTVDTLFYLTPFPNYDIYFLFTLTQSINWKTMDESTGVPSLSKAVIEKVTRTFPSFEEQKKIGLFFKQLDETISHHQQKIDNMKSLKRALLNKMFI